VRHLPALRLAIGAPGAPGFSEHQAQVVILDAQAARFLNAKAMAARKTASELVASMVRKELSHAY
jgi:hypothetical protein